MTTTLLATLPLARTGRGQRFFDALSEGNWLAWVFLILGTIGFIWWCVDHYSKKAAKADARKPERNPTTAGEEPCPHCGGALRRGASFCKHCREFLS